MLNCSASLVMSTSILKALLSKLDIKRHSPSILYVLSSVFRDKAYVDSDNQTVAKIILHNYSVFSANNGPNVSGKCLYFIADALVRIERSLFDENRVKKYVCVIRKYHYYTLRTNPRLAFDLSGIAPRQWYAYPFNFNHLTYFLWR